MRKDALGSNGSFSNGERRGGPYASPAMISGRATAWPSGLCRWIAVASWLSNKPEVFRSACRGALDERPRVSSIRLVADPQGSHPRATRAHNLDRHATA